MYIHLLIKTFMLYFKLLYLSYVASLFYFYALHNTTNQGIQQKFEELFILIFLHVHLFVAIIPTQESFDKYFVRK